MAIGSSPEIGTRFKSCRDYTASDWELWWEWMRENWSPYLQAGHSVLVHDKNNRFYKGGKVNRDYADELVPVETVLEIQQDRNVIYDELRAVTADRDRWRRIAEELATGAYSVSYGRLRDALDKYEAASTDGCKD